MLSKKNRKDLNSVVLVTGLTFLVLLIFDKFFNVHSNTIVVEDKFVKIEPKRATSITSKSELVNIPSPIAEIPVQIPVVEVVKKESVEPPSVHEVGKVGLFGSNIVCPDSVHQKYSSPDDTSTFEKDLAWCKERVSRNRVQIGKTWGSMTKDQQMKWDKVKCNEIIARGKLQTCDERWGWASFDDWLRNSKTIIEGASTVKCAANIKTATFCQHGNVVLDFSKAVPRHNQRNFMDGFIQTFGSKKMHAGSYPNFPGARHAVLEGKSDPPFCCPMMTSSIWVTTTTT